MKRAHILPHPLRRAALAVVLLLTLTAVAPGARAQRAPTPETAAALRLDDIELAGATRLADVANLDGGCSADGFSI